MVPLNRCHATIVRHETRLTRRPNASTPTRFSHSAGASHNVGYWCSACERWATKDIAHVAWLPKAHVALTGVVRDGLPRIALSDPVDCEICLKRTATPELHHWCPRSLFRDTELPGEGPQAWLCPQCHALWHHVVTPMLVGGVTRARCEDFLRRMVKRMTVAEWLTFVNTVTDVDVATRAYLESRVRPAKQEGAA